jgi:hypothetical protein
MSLKNLRWIAALSLLVIPVLVAGRPEVIHMAGQRIHRKLIDQSESGDLDKPVTIW